MSLPKNKTRQLLLRKFLGVVGTYSIHLAVSLDVTGQRKVF